MCSTRPLRPSRPGSRAQGSSPRRVVRVERTRPVFLSQCASTRQLIAPSSQGCRVSPKHTDAGSKLDRRFERITHSPAALTHSVVLSDVFVPFFSSGGLKAKSAQVPGVSLLRSCRQRGIQFFALGFRSAGAELGAIQSTEESGASRGWLVCVFVGRKGEVPLRWDGVIDLGTC